MLINSFQKNRLKTYDHSARLMGNQFLFTVVAKSENWAKARIQDAITEIQRIERIFTTFDESSQTCQINAKAGIAPVKVDPEVFDLIARSMKISGLTQGAFDITYGSMDKHFWNFDQTMAALPDKEIAKHAVHLINYKNVELNKKNCTIFLKKRGMRIGFGGIGKGYAADRAKAVLKGKGVESGIINASGDLCAWGTQPDDKPWTIGVADPRLKGRAFADMTLKNSAVATSGDYEKYVTIGGKRYSHTIDPKTGYPITGITSTTIIAPTAELADALTTPVMIMGRKAGMSLVNQLHGIACIMMDDNERFYFSDNVKML